MENTSVVSFMFTLNQNRMKEKEKAKELVDNFLPHSTGNSNINEAKQCALIAVDEIIKKLKSIEFNHDIENLSMKYW